MVEELSGALVLYKPKGLISKDLSRWFKRVTGLRKIKLGHVGTLDPMAEGVMPLLLGRATKLQDYLHLAAKCYRFDLKLGEARDTLDSEGRVTECRTPPTIEIDAVAKVVANLVGTHNQIPPFYSAVKYKGRPLYDYARKGQEHLVPIQELERKISVYSSRLIRVDPENAIVSVEVESSKGTYIRVLAQEICKELNSIGHLVRLVRPSSSGFTVDDCVSMAEIEKNPSMINSLMVPLNKIPLELKRFKVLKAAASERLLMGQKIEISTEAFVTELPKGGSTMHDKLLLIDAQEKIIGLGQCQYLDHGVVRVALRRGI